MPTTRVGAIDEIAAADAEALGFAARFEADYRGRNRPVVIRGGGAGWPAVGKWTPAYVAEACGSRETTAHYFGQHGSEKRSRLPADELLRRIEQGADDEGLNAYLAQGMIAVGDHGGAALDDAELPALKPDCPLPAWLRDKTGIMLQAFIGKDSYAMMHFHPGVPTRRTGMEALKTQVVGRKTALLFSPDADLRQSFDPIEKWNISAVSFADWLADRDGVVAALDGGGGVPHECVLEPGDMLFIPAYWWHSFFGHGWSMSATYFWRDADPAGIATSRAYRATEEFGRRFQAVSTRGGTSRTTG